MSALTWWLVRYPVLPQLGVRERWRGALGALPLPVVFDLEGTPEGVVIRLGEPTRDGALAPVVLRALGRAQVQVTPCAAPPAPWPAVALVPERPGLLPPPGDDLFPALARWLVVHRARLQIHLLGEEHGFQERLRRALARGPEVWAREQAVAGLFLFLGFLGLGGSFLLEFLGGGFLGAGLLCLVSLGLLVAGLVQGHAVGRLRDLPREELERLVESRLFRAVLLLRGETVPAPPLPQLRLGPRVRAVTEAPAFPVSATWVAAFLAPPETTGAEALLWEGARQEVPAAPAAAAYRRARYRVGEAVADGTAVGLEPEAHLLVVGGSRSGKSSLLYHLVTGLLTEDDPPGLLLLDPHLNLSDAVLRAALGHPRVRERLVVVGPDCAPLGVPLNLCCAPDPLAGAAVLALIGRRLWPDYWGPRMEQAFLACYHLAHAWNARQEGEGPRLGLTHLPFLAYNRAFRRETLQLLEPARRPLAVALEGLLGQFAERTGRWEQQWATEVVSPIWSKVMALAQAPWLYQSLHLGGYLPFDTLIRQRTWILVRADVGRLGPIPARLLGAVVYGLFEAAFRRVATAAEPIPYVVAVDELAEVGQGLELETLLQGGAKFGVWVWAAVQSLQALLAQPETRALGLGLLANTSAQAVFRPAASDQETVERLFQLRDRYGPHTYDLPALHCLVRAALEGRMQPPVLVRLAPLPRVPPEEAQAHIRAVLAARPDLYRDLSPVPEQTAELLGLFTEGLSEEVREVLLTAGPGEALIRYFATGEAP